MKRIVLLTSLIAVGAMTYVAAQQGGQKPMVVEVEKLKDNLFVLKGGGGNTTVFVQSNGITVVDTKNPGWGAPILAKIKELSPKTITTIVNTHTHGDHVSGNVEFPTTVDIVVQENTATNMKQMRPVTGLSKPGAPPAPNIFEQNGGKGLPKRTFKDRMTIGKGPDQIDLYYFGRGHTNGDAWIAFPALRIVHSGDIFASKSVPLIDEANGGSMMEISGTLMKAYNGIKNVDQIINGHTPAQTTWADLKEYAEFNKDLVTWMEAGLKAGKTPEQIAAEWKVPEKYKGYSSTVSTLMGGMAGRVATLQKEMKK